jgi:hypothetical protein
MLGDMTTEEVQLMILAALRRYTTAMADKIELSGRQDMPPPNAEEDSNRLVGGRY